MRFYTLQPVYDKDGDTVFRSVGVTEGDLGAMVDWGFEHQKGREHTKATFKPMLFEWTDPSEKAPCDFPSSSDNIFSAAAVGVLRGMLEASGDLYPIKLESSDLSYYYFDCWENFEVQRNAGFNFLDESTWRCLVLKGGSLGVDIFSAYKVPGLLVSEKFKDIVEKAELVGFDFRPIEVIVPDTK